MASKKISQLPNPVGTLDGTELNPVVQTGVTVKAATSALGYKRSGTGTSARTLSGKVDERVSVKDFGAACNGTTDDTAALQAAINYCATFQDWPTLVIPGPCLVTASVNIDRLVDTETSEFRILGEGPGAGFVTNGNVTVFNSTLPVTTAPQSEKITFENLYFTTSSIFNTSYLLSEKFLRLKFINCDFYILRCMTSTIYAQTIYFIDCSIRNNPASFLSSAGLYDVTFNSCIIKNGSRLVYCVDASRGTNGLRLINNVIENIYGNSIVSCTGATGFLAIGNHMENNYDPAFNFFAGGVTNKSISFIANYMYNPNSETVYYGPTEFAYSANNSCFPNLFHENVVQVQQNFISIADYAPGGISDATNIQVVNGVYRAGNPTTTAWTDTSNQFAKDTSGRIGIGYAIQSDVRLAVAGSDQTDANYAGIFYDSNGNVITGFRNDRLVWMPALGDYADDAAAAAAGVDVDFLYRTGSVVKVRVT